MDEDEGKREEWVEVGKKSKTIGRKAKNSKKIVIV